MFAADYGASDVTWPTGRAPVEQPLTVADMLEPRAAPGTYPVPAGRGRWRLTVHSRQFLLNTTAAQTILAELAGARSRRLDQQWCAPATLTFVVDGHSPAAALLNELQTDVYAWRWDDQTGQDIPVCRAIVAQSEDEISEQTHTVTFTCHDYLAMLARRMLTVPMAVTQMDQDWIANALMLRATTAVATSAGTSLSPGAYLPLTVGSVNPDGSGRSMGSGSVLRDRTYPPQTLVSDAFDQLAKVIGGFDYDTRPNVSAQAADPVRIFYPYQGVARSDIALVYGSSVSSLTRSVDSGDYANYQRVLGNNGSSDPAAAQLYSEAVNSDANNVTVTPVGLWMSGDNQADVTIQSTLDETAQGDLALSGVLQPSYSLSLRPDWYTWGNPNMGDVVPLVVQSGRLNVATTVRVLGITYDIGDDGQEDVTLTVGRPAVAFADLLGAQSRDVNALARR